MQHANRTRTALLAVMLCGAVGCGASADGASGDGSAVRTRVESTSARNLALNGTTGTGDGTGTTGTGDGTTGTGDGTGTTGTGDGTTDGGTTTDGGSTGPGPGTAPADALPEFDSATADHVREVVARGQSMGNRRDVFAKIGDSITESASYLSDCGYGWYDLGSYTSLQPTVQFFSTQIVDGERNSFNRASVSAVAGWTSDQALMNDGAQPLITELDTLHPQWAFIMYGTNDLDHVDVNTYLGNMNTILDITEARGVVPVLFTIPPRMDSSATGALSASFADAIRTLAHSRHIPLIDYNAAMTQLPNGGISSDGIHPNLYLDDATSTGDSCVLTAAGLQFGYNVRNLLTIQMLARLMAY